MTEELKPMIDKQSALKAELAALECELEKELSKAKAEALACVKADIFDFGFTPADLFGADVLKPAKMRVAVSKPKLASVKPKYSNSAGQTWAGRGARPAWLKASLSAGATLESFKIAA